jgi:hypothetical protein
VHRLCDPRVCLCSPRRKVEVLDCATTHRLILAFLRGTYDVLTCATTHDDFLLENVSRLDNSRVCFVCIGAEWDVFFDSTIEVVNPVWRDD